MTSAILRALFPSRPRHFPGQRWVNIALRSAHLVGVAGIGGGFLFTPDEVAWEAYWHLTWVTGGALSALYLLPVAVVIPEIRAESFVLVIAISGVIAHAPARVRGYRWLRLPDVSDRSP
jgi:hypothetical protein